MNDYLISSFKTILKYYLLINKNSKEKKKPEWKNLSFRIKAYEKAIYILSTQFKNTEITNIDQVKDVKGFGKSIVVKIKEYLDTGIIKLSQDYEEIMKNMTPSPTDSEKSVIESFTQVWGIGPAKAKELYDKGFKTITDLRKNTQYLTENQKIGLQYYEHLKEKIPRDYITIFSKAMKTILSYELGSENFKMEIAGSYRRGAEKSGDVDCLITSDVYDLEDIVNILVKWNIVTEVLSMRGEKFMGIAHCPKNYTQYFRMDIEYLPKEEWGSGLLYFTGSKTFNIQMRIDAKKYGYTLNQHGLFKGSKRLPYDTEKDIMKAVGMKYVPPNLR